MHLETSSSGVVSSVLQHVDDVYCRATTTVCVDILKECIIMAMVSHRPNEAAWNAVKRTLVYLSKNPSYVVKFGSDRTEVNVYADAGYGDHVDSKSQTGAFITIGNNGRPVICKSKKQSLVSSTEAEMCALTNAVKRAMPVARLLVELGLNDRIKINVFQDNTIHLAKSGEGLGGKAKHFRVRFQFLKESREGGILNLEYCNTKTTIADMLTKPMIGKERYRQVVRLMFDGDHEAFEKAQ